MPNAFTPNNDGLNDVFQPVGLFFGLEEYNLSIWNRWGESIFESDDVEYGWNGRIQNSGEHVPQGVYVYLVKYKDSLNKNREIKGSVTLLK